VDDGPARWLVFAAVAVIVADLHLYDRAIRWVVAVSGWLGAVLVIGAPVVGGEAAPWLADAGLGFGFVVLSAVALKERYCFRVPIVVAVPPLLAGSLIPLRLGADAVAAAPLVGGAAVLAILAVAKLRMPLHYDIGDKSHYQV
ncbi:MAG: DUF2301 domain-containing membrane protein, partial [Myxococcota bacterium]